MKPIKFNGHNAVYAENQPEYLPLPVYRDNEGTCVSCWSLTWGERLRLLFQGNIWWTQLTFNTPLQPIRPSVDSPLPVERA